MTGKTENIVLEILRRIQEDMAELKAGQRDIQHRLTLVETRLAGVERNLADHYAAYASQSARVRETGGKQGTDHVLCRHLLARAQFLNRPLPSGGFDRQRKSQPLRVSGLAESKR